jgi:hypothetical protein
MAMLMLLPANLRAAEQTLMVRLQEKIKTNIAQINDLQTSYQSQKRDLYSELEQTVEAIQETEDYEQKEHLTKVYYHKRAENLLAAARPTAEAQRLLTQTHQHMVRLQQAMQKSGQGASPVSLDEKQSAGLSMRGLAAYVRTLSRLSPDNPRLARASRALELKDAYFQSIFRDNSMQSLQKQIEVVEDLSSYVAVILDLMEEERKYLQFKVANVIQTSVVRETEALISSFSDLLEGGFGDREHGLDEIVDEELAQTVSSSNDNSLQINDLRNVGHYE